MKHEPSSKRSRSPSSRQISPTLSRPSSFSKEKAPPTFNRDASSSKQDLLTIPCYSPETKPKTPASEKQTGKTIDATKGSKWSDRFLEENNGITIDSPTKDDFKKEENIRSTINKSDNSGFFLNENEKPDDKYIKKIKRKFEKGGANIAFAEYNIDGKANKIDSFSGKMNLKGFAPYVENDKRQLKAKEASAPGKPGEGYLRDADTEGKILEQIIRQTTDKSAGTIRLFTQRLVCDSCGDVIEQFKKERPYIEITVVERET